MTVAEFIIVAFERNRAQQMIAGLNPKYHSMPIMQMSINQVIEFAEGAHIDTIKLVQLIIDTNQNIKIKKVA